MPVLYRKYRPQRFAEVVGQQHITQTLSNAVASNSAAHAYLFTGSRGVGKTSVARILAKAVNCLAPKDGDADGKCEICLAISDNNFLDLVEIDAASNTGVENVRDLIEHVKFKPSRAQFKVFIIDEVHMLSKAAFNALLKTLEEPPAHAIFILATTDIQKVPETIISRTQRFDFRKITEADILRHITEVAEQEKLVLAPEILRLVASGAQGGLRDALSLLDKVSSLGNNVSLTEAQALLGRTSIGVSQQLFGLIATKRAAELPGFFDQLLAQGLDFLALNRDMLEYCRKVLVYKVSGDKVELSLLPEDFAVLREQAQLMSNTEIMHLIRLFLRSYKELPQAPTADLPLLLASIEASIKPGAPNNNSPEPAPAAQPNPMRKLAASEFSKESSVDPKSNIISEVLIVEEQATDNLAEIVDDIGREEVIAIWPVVIEKVKAINSPLATLLKNSPMQEVRQGTITLAVKYLFHKEHLESKKNYALVTGVIQDICGRKVRLSVKISKEAPSASGIAQSLDAIGDALKVFGGELVE